MVGPIWRGQASYFFPFLVDGSGGLKNSRNCAELALDARWLLKICFSVLGVLPYCYIHYFYRAHTESSLFIPRERHTVLS